MFNASFAKSPLVLLLLSATLTLSACNEKAQTSVDTSTASSEAAAPEVAANSAQTLTSSDNKITLTVEQGGYEDKSKEAEQLLSPVKDGDLTLLQYNPYSDITLHVESLGAPKRSADEYFAKLSQTIKSAKNVRNVNIGEATENRMNYTFSSEEDGQTLNESCVALYSKERLYNICASSSTADIAKLDTDLKNIVLH